jgi:hypothetical protein
MIKPSTWPFTARETAELKPKTQTPALFKPDPAIVAMSKAERALEIDGGQARMTFIFPDEASMRKADALWTALTKKK